MAWEFWGLRTPGDPVLWNGASEPNTTDLARSFPVRIWRNGEMILAMEVKGAYWGGAREGEHLMGRNEEHHQWKRGDWFELEGGLFLTLDGLKKYLSEGEYYR